MANPHCMASEIAVFEYDKETLRKGPIFLIQYNITLLAKTFPLPPKGHISHHRAGLPTQESSVCNPFPVYARYCLWNSRSIGHHRMTPVAYNTPTVTCWSEYRIHPLIRQRGLWRTRTAFPINFSRKPVWLLLLFCPLKYAAVCAAVRMYFNPMQ